MPIELISFKTSDELAAAVAEKWLAEVIAAAGAGKTHRVALSGGRITLKFFASVTAQVSGQGSAISGVDFFWADERCVPPDHADSNFAAANLNFFQPLGIVADRVYRIRGGDSPEFAARQAEAELCRLAPLAPNGQPILDLVLLGMGEDGHVASLFPASVEVDRAVRATFQPVLNSPKPPPNRVTLSYAAIAAARQIWVLASGNGKEAALAESLRPGGRTPLAQVLSLRPDALVFTDIVVG